MNWKNAKELNYNAKKSDDKYIFFYFNVNFAFTIKLKKSLTLRRSTEKTQMNISICLRISARSVHTIGRFAKWRSQQNFEDIPVHNYKATPAWTAILDVTMRETLVVFQNKLKRCDMLRNTYNFSSNNDFGFNSFSCGPKGFPTQTSLESRARFRTWHLRRTRQWF